MAAATKDTIYIDIDDEITGIIDKVQASKHKIVALVLPKRATTLQSIVNMRLLKRTGEETDKRIVLITSEANLLPLAGIVGMHVAKTLQSKPAIPPAPAAMGAGETVVDDDSALDEKDLDPKKSVGELAGMPAKPEASSLGSLAVEETIDVDNTEEGDEAAAAMAGGKKAKKDKKIKIPNFESFRLRLFLAVFLLIALIVGWVFAFKVLPKASVTVKTDTASVTSTLNFTAQTAATGFDVETAVMPAESKESKKTDTAKVTATGKRNDGTKATGTMTLTNCIKDDSAHTVPAGTGFSSGGLSFVTQQDVVLPIATFQGSTCRSANVGDSKTVSVVAAQSGGSSNLSARGYTAPGSLSGVLASGSAMTGGTDKITIVVSQGDVDGASAGLVDKSKDAAIAELSKMFTDAKLIPLPETITSNIPVVTPSPSVGDESGDVTVTSVTTYTMLGVKADYLQKLIAADAKKQIDITKQPIVDYGLDKATYHLANKRDGNDQTLTLQTVSTAGTKIEPEALKKEIVGMKKGDVQKTVEAHPGVKEVTVNYSPFWVNKIPNKLPRITIVFEQTKTNGK